MSQMIPFITVDDCQAAITFYEKVFQAKLVGEITFLENVPGMEQYSGKIGHSTLQIGDTTFFMNDSLEDYPLDQGDRIQFVLDLPSEDQLRNVFDMLQREGTIITELQEVFWGALFGTVKDKYGVTWQIYSRIV
jgi:PhnB protein